VKQNEPGLLPLGDILKQITPAPIRENLENPIKPLTRVQSRLLEPCSEHELEICFQHSVLCQTGLPALRASHSMKFLFSPGHFSSP